MAKGGNRFREIFWHTDDTDWMDYKDFSFNSFITEKIIKAFYKVYNTLGFGFLEKVYENALHLELLEMGFDVEKQKRLEVYYLGKRVGEYNADLIVEELVIVELKANECLLEEHEKQLINYLKATEIEVGLLLNFGKKPEVRRKIFDNEHKKLLKEK